MTAKIEIELARASAHYEPEEVVAGELRIRSEERETIEAIEISLAWTTSGPGDPDEGRAVLETRAAGDLQLLQDGRLQASFALRLPQFPLSYEGELLGVAWHLRVEVSPTLARSDVPIVVGQVAPPNAW